MLSAMLTRHSSNLCQIVLQQHLSIPIWGWANYCGGLLFKLVPTPDSNTCATSTYMCSCGEAGALQTASSFPSWSQRIHWSPWMLDGESEIEREREREWESERASRAKWSRHCFATALVWCMNAFWGRTETYNIYSMGNRLWILCLQLGSVFVVVWLDPSLTQTNPLFRSFPKLSGKTTLSCQCFMNWFLHLLPPLQPTFARLQPACVPRPPLTILVCFSVSSTHCTQTLPTQVAIPPFCHTNGIFCPWAEFYMVTTLELFSSSFNHIRW